MHARLAAAEAADHHEISNPGSALAPGVRQQSRGAASLPACTTLTLPIPPSVNAMFKNLPGRGRGKTAEYRNWILEASVELKQQQPNRISGRVLISISVERDSEAADIDNRVKALLDLLVQPGLKKSDRAYGVIDDDRFVTGILLSWAPRGRSRRGWARIAIMPVHSCTATFHPTPDGATGGWFINAPENDGDI